MPKCIGSGNCRFLNSFHIKWWANSNFLTIFVNVTALSFESVWKTTSRKESTLWENQIPFTSMKILVVFRPHRVVKWVWTMNICLLAMTLSKLLSDPGKVSLFLLSPQQIFFIQYAILIILSMYLIISGSSLLVLDFNSLCHTGKPLKKYMKMYSGFCTLELTHDTVKILWW